MSRSWKWLQWSALTLLVIIGGLWQFFPLKDASDRLDSLPLAGIGFNSHEFEVTEVEREVFKDNRLLKRLVSMSGQQFFLSIIDGSKYRNAVHDPTICFLGEGFTVDRRETIRVPGGYGELIHLVKREEKKEVFLCFSDGKNRYANLIRYWAATTLRRLTFGLSGDEPVRIIIQPVDGRSLKWRRLLLEYSPLWEV
jgi:hypothetical protein